MPADLMTRAGAAMRWRALQLAGVELIYFVRLLILAKLLAPEAFGVLAIAVAAVGVLMRLSELGMIPALVQRREATVAQFDAAWTVGLARAGVVAAFLVVAAPWIATAFGEPAATPVIQVLALRPVLEAASSIGVASLTRELRFRELALLRFPGATVDLLVAVVLANSFGVWALVAGTLAGSATTTILSYAFAPHQPRLAFAWETIAPLVRFGRWVLLTSVVALLGTTVLQLAVSRIHGATALGLYFLASKVAFLPVDAASAIVGSVAFPMFARIGNDVGRTAIAFSRFFTGLALVLVPLYGMLFVLAPSIESALGERWAGASPIIQILSVAAVMGILGEMMVPLFRGQGRPDRATMLEAVQTLVIVGSVWPLVHAYGAMGAAFAWLMGNTVAALAGIPWLGETLGGKRYLEPGWLAAALVAAVIAVAVCSLVATTVDGFSGIVVAGLVGTLTTGLVIMVSERQFDLGLMDFARTLTGFGDRIP